MIKDRLIPSSPDNSVKIEKKAAFTPPFFRGGIQMAKRAGFTLIEMLIVTAILSVISLTVYATMSSGVKIWQRVNRGIPAEDIDIFFEKFASDLRSGLKYAAIPFSGEEDGFELTTLVNSRRMERTTVGKVRYKFDQAKGEITRQRIDYSAVYDSEDGEQEVLLRGIRSLRFTYYTHNKDNNEYLWQDEWINQAPPLAVRIELGLKSDEQTNEFTKTVSIPAS